MKLAAKVALAAAVSTAAAALWVSYGIYQVRARQATSEAVRPAAARFAVVGRVEVAAEAKALAPSDAVVVVYAFAQDGPRVPLAVWRRPATALPADFKLDDSAAVNPAFRLSQAAQLVIGARLGRGEA
jgi:cytochrome c-type biogenesis protein CcmH